MNEIFKHFHDLLMSLPHVHERQRRQWDVVSFVAATAALTLATYNTVQILKLEMAIEAQQAKTNLLSDISKLHEQHLHKLDGMIDDIGKELQVVKVQQTFLVKIERIIAQINSDEHKLRAVIATFERIIITAFKQRLAPGALSTDVLNQIIYHINEIATNNHFDKFVHEPADLYKLEVSFIHRPEDYTIILVLHVPFVEAEHLLPLYESVSLPIHFNFSANISVVPDIGRADLITIGDTGTFQTLSSSDLAGCRRLGQTFFCEGCMVLKTNLVNDCLGSLFMASSTPIKANCKFQIFDTREKIFSLGNNTWLVYSVGTIATNQVCPKAKTTSPVTISSGQTLSVQPGCHIQTMDHIITAEESDDFKIYSTWLDWTMTLAQLFNHEDTEQLLQLVNQIRSTISGTFDASELLQRLDSLNKPFQADHWLFSLPAAMIGVVCLIALASFVIYSKCCSKSSPPTTELPAPSAHLTPTVTPLLTLQPPAMTYQTNPIQYNKAAVAPKSITIIKS
jgi:hypothetical protein